MHCLLCGETTSDPVDLAPAKPWWSPMVKCENSDCLASGVDVVPDHGQFERNAYANPDATWPRFAHSGTERWFVSTIYRESSAPYGVWYYETYGYLLTAEDQRRWLYEYGSGYARKALRVHSILAKRAGRLYPVV